MAEIAESMPFRVLLGKTVTQDGNDLKLLSNYGQFVNEASDICNNVDLRQGTMDSEAVTIAVNNVLRRLNLFNA